MKKILLVANSSRNIQNFRLNVIHAFIAKGYTVCIAAPIDRYTHQLENLPKVMIIPLYHLKRKSTNPIADFRLMLELYNVYKKINPDFVFHYTIKPNVYGGIVSRILKIKNIAVITGLGYTYIHKGFIYASTNILYKLSVKHACRIIFENMDDRLLFIQKKIVTKNNSVSLKGCGIDLAHFQPVVSQHELNRTQKKIIFSYIGRFLYDKGIREFVKAAETVKGKFPDAEFWLIGSEDFDNPASIKEAELKSWSDQKIIINKGFAEDVRVLIAESDCIVCPSYREAIPKVLQEGMAMEKMVITTDVPGCYEAVDNNINGFVVEVKNATALADSFIKAIKMTAHERALFGKAGRKKAIENFDDKLIAQQIIQLIENVG